jgi:tetratricopeptide (TPR) repeat protein/transcriptional regulator with XRE-family HTH domain
MRGFGELLVLFTNRAGISDSELARAIGIQRQTIFRWKEGQTSRPRYREDVLRMADKLRLTPEERDELLLAAGFPPEVAQRSLSLAAPDPPTADDSMGTPAPLVLPATPPAQTVPPELLPAPSSAALPAALPPRAPTAPTLHPRPPRLIPNPGFLLGAAAALMLLVAVAGYFVLPLIFGPRPTLTPTPVPVTVSGPISTPSPAVPTPTPIVAMPGEKLLLVAPFVGYTSEELRFNVAGRIEEAVQRQIADAGLPNVRVAVLPMPVTAQIQALAVLSATQGSALIWGEYDAGRVRANVTVPGEDETNWTNPVDSPARLSLVINEDVPNAARILALTSLGRLYRQEGDYATALSTFEQALALKPQDPTTAASLHFYVGNLLPKVQGIEVGVLSQAIDHFTAALALKPQWENLLYNRGTNYLGRALLSLDETADLDAAIADLSAVIEVLPRGVDPLLNRGIALYQRNGPGDIPAAIADFSRAIKLAPQDYRGYYHRGLAGIRGGGLAGWSDDLLAAKARNPQYVSVDNGLCWGFALGGETAAAQPYCEAAVAADPTGSSFDGRAMVYAGLGRYAEAVADLKQYLLWVQSEHPELYTKFHGPEAEEWIAALEQDENPFTPEVRAALR